MRACLWYNPTSIRPHRVVGGINDAFSIKKRVLADAHPSYGTALRLGASFSRIEKGAGCGYCSARIFGGKHPHACRSTHNWRLFRSPLYIRGIRTDKLVRTLP